MSGFDQHIVYTCMKLSATQRANGKRKRQMGQLIDEVSVLGEVRKAWN